MDSSLGSMNLLKDSLWASDAHLYNLTMLLRQRAPLPSQRPQTCLCVDSRCAFEASFELSHETTLDYEGLLEALGLFSMTNKSFQGINPRNKQMFVQWRYWKEGAAAQTEDPGQRRCDSISQAKNSISIFCPSS